MVDRRFDVVCMLVSVRFCVEYVNTCVMTQLGGCLSLIRYYGLERQLFGIYPITHKGDQLLFTPDADILVLC